MSGTLGEAVSAAAMRTMRGGAQVGLKVHTSVPDFEGLSEYSGVVDFDMDRCRLDGESHIAGETAPESAILDGPTTYTRESDARWVFTRGGVGTRGMLHPGGLLNALVQAQTSVVAAAEDSVELGLDHDVLDAAADAGLAPDWQSTAVARISPTGRISNIVLTHRSVEDPDSLMRVECAISEPVEVDGIELPPAEATISLAAKINRSTTKPKRDDAAASQVAAGLSPTKRRTGAAASGLAAERAAVGTCGSAQSPAGRVVVVGVRGSVRPWRRWSAGGASGRRR